MENSTNKKAALQQAKQVILGIFIDGMGQNLKVVDAQRVLDCCLHLIQEESLVIIEEGKKFKAKDESEDEVDFRVRNPEMNKFLTNIDLADEAQGSINKQQQQFTIDINEEKNSSEWSPLYYCLENVAGLL